MHKSVPYSVELLFIFVLSNKEILLNTLIPKIAHMPTIIVIHILTFSYHGLSDFFIFHNTTTLNFCILKYFAVNSSIMENYIIYRSYGQVYIA